MGWKSIKAASKAITKEWNEAERNRPRPEDQLYDLRLNAGLDLDPDTIRRLAEFEGEFRRCERAKTNLWRIHCKATWFKLGDAPNPHFVNLLQAKRIRERIKILTTLEGGVTEDEDKILGLVFDHYWNLYTWDCEVEGHIPLRDEILSLIDTKFSEEDNQLLKEVLDVDEIQRVVFAFPKGKSHGGGGVTYDFLQET